jgi:hypothetical protein
MSFTTALAYLAGITVSFLVLIFGSLWLVGFLRRSRTVEVDQPLRPEATEKRVKAAKA